MTAHVNPEPKAEREPRLNLTDEERQAIALCRLTPVPDPADEGKLRLPTWEEVAALFSRESRVIRNAFEQAFCGRIVKAIALPKPPVPCGRVVTLERELLQEYPHIQSAIVLETEPVHRVLNAQSADDEIHRVLGHEVAKIIADGLAFETGSRIGLGAGRGVFYTVDALFAREPLPRDGITVFSMTGSVEARDYVAKVAFHMDADIHALMMMRSICGASAKFISAPIAVADPKDLDRIRSQTVLSPTAWKELSPTHAVVGVGVLARGHRFYEETVNPQHRSVLGPIQPQLKDLVDLSEKFSVAARIPNYHPVADVCHRLFFVPPPSEVAAAKEIEDQLKKCIADVNSRMLSVSVEQLESIPKTIIVAGTERKAPAIAGLLKNRKIGIFILCTDKRAALKILNRA